jgi:hypothetical protein
MRLILLLSFVIVSGCDLGTYSKRYSERIGTMTSMANSNKNLADTQISVGGGAKFRIPKICYYEGSGEYTSGSDDNLARIPGIDLKGFTASYLGDVEYESKFLPFQIYFYFVGKDVYPGAQEAQTEIKKEIRTVLKNTEISWSNQTIVAYDGTEHAWATATVTAGLPFSVFQDGSPKPTNLPGRMDLCLTTNNRGTLIVVFRAPADIFGHDQEPLVEGTLKSIQGFK